MRDDLAVPNTIVVGAGPAGLAVAACLERAGVSSLLLEQSDRVGSAWHRHYERLHLHTDRRHSELPGLSFPRGTPRYPSREQVIRYLEAYAEHFGLEPRFGEHVAAARPAGGGWEVETNHGRYRARNLVIATGTTREPVRPTWPGQDRFSGAVLHSSEYRNGEPFAGQQVLVIGFGNSGGEIAVDLVESGARATLAVRSPVNVIPRELFGIPILAIGILQSHLPQRLADAMNGPLLRFVTGDLTRYGLRRLPYGPVTQIRREGRVPLIDVGTIDLVKKGRIAVRPGVERLTERGVVFADGREEDFDSVILATGYRPRVNEFLEGAAAVHDDGGTPLASGRESALPGLYFCGFRVSPTGMLREIGIEARRISAQIAGS